MLSSIVMFRKLIFGLETASIGDLDHNFTYF